MAIRANYPDILPTLNLDFANTKKLDPRITFTRTTTGTYYDGKTTAKAEENLLQYSEQFDNAYWTKNAVSVTANTVTAPDGTTTAETITSSDSVAFNVGVYRAITAATGYTFSCYVKANTSTKAFISDNSSANVYGVFDLSAVSVLTSAGCTASITSVGNSWYRLVLANITVSPTFFIVGGKDTYTSGNPWAAGTWTSGNSIYIWGAQIEQRSSVTAYTATTTAPITNYIPVLQTAAAGQARFDHNPTTGESLGLLIEESRANLFTYSADFANGVWQAGSNISVTSNTIIAPDGTLTGDTITRGTTTTGETALRVTTTQAISTTYTLSVFAKAGSSGSLLYVRNIAVDGTVPNGLVTFALDGTNTITAGSTYTNKATITPVGNNWYRCSITGTTPASISNNLIDIGCSTTAGNYTGTSGAFLFLWGAQLEAGAFATSYYPTTTTSLTRNADEAIMTGLNCSTWINQNEGTFTATTTSTLGISNGAARIIAYNGAQTFLNYGSDINVQSYNGSIVVTKTGSLSTNTNVITSGNSYSQTSQSLTRDGLTVATGSLSPNGPITTIGIGKFIGSNLYQLNGRLKKVSYYPKKVSDTELQALTLA